MARSPGTTRGFLQAVNKWTKETEERSEQAFREGALDFYMALRDATPVDTGNLRDSLVASNSAAPEPAFPTGPENGALTSGINESLATIGALKLGDRIRYMYRASYARRVNNGFTGFDSLGRYYNQAGRFWIEQVGARYRSIMRAAATRIRGSQ